MGHSSGGFTATATAVPELQARNRKQGGVVGIFYVCGFEVPVGESVHSFFQAKDGSEPVIPPCNNFHKHGFAGRTSTQEGAKYFFNGLDEAKPKYYESTLTVSAIFTTVLQNDAYAVLLCTYLVAENDLALPPAYQEGMVTLQNQRPDINIRVVRCPSGNSPHLTWTEGLVADVRNLESWCLDRINSENVSICIYHGPGNIDEDIGETAMPANISLSTTAKA